MIFVDTGIKWVRTRASPEGEIPGVGRVEVNVLRVPPPIFDLRTPGRPTPEPYKPPRTQYTRSGEADIAVQAEHEIRCTRGATFLPYPAVFQQTIVFLGGVGTSTKEVEAAKSYLAFLTGPNALTAIKAHCLTPG